MTGLTVLFIYGQETYTKLVASINVMYIIIYNTAYSIHYVGYYTQSNPIDIVQCAIFCAHNVDMRKLAHFSMHYI